MANNSDENALDEAAKKIAEQVKKALEDARKELQEQLEKDRENRPK